MATNKIRHLPVVDREVIVGIVSDRDIKLAATMYGGRSDEEIQVRDLCLSEPYIEDESCLLRRALKQMLDRRYGCVLVARRDKLSGIFTMIDAGDLLIKMLSC